MGFQAFAEKFQATVSNVLRTFLATPTRKEAHFAADYREHMHRDPVAAKGIKPFISADMDEGAEDSPERNLVTENRMKNKAKLNTKKNDQKAAYVLMLFYYNILIHGLGTNGKLPVSKRQQESS